MTTAAEFSTAGITGQTFREIPEKFGMTWNELGQTDKIMANYALAFAFFRDREHLKVQDAYDKAMTLTIKQIEALFDDEPETPEEKAVVDFAAPPSTTTP
jgi:hypothetical protein